MNTTTKFDEVKLSQTKRGKCPLCGKKSTRTKTFWQSRNPWNLNAEGQVKSIKEMYQSLSAEADAWDPDYRHGSCR